MAENINRISCRNATPLFCFSFWPVGSGVVCSFFWLKPSRYRRRYAPAGNTGIIAATGITPHTATTDCSRLCQTILRAVQRESGPIEGPPACLHVVHLPPFLLFYFGKVRGPASGSSWRHIHLPHRGNVQARLQLHGHGHDPSLSPNFRILTPA